MVRSWLWRMFVPPFSLNDEFGCASETQRRPDDFWALDLYVHCRCFQIGCCTWLPSVVSGLPLRVTILLQQMHVKMDRWLKLEVSFKSPIAPFGSQNDLLLRIFTNWMWRSIMTCNVILRAMRRWPNWRSSSWCPSISQLKDTHSEFPVFQTTLALKQVWTPCSQPKSPWPFSWKSHAS